MDSVRGGNISHPLLAIKDSFQLKRTICAMSSTVVFVGAGASNALGLPLTQDIFPMLLKRLMSTPRGCCHTVLFLRGYQGRDTSDPQRVTVVQTEQKEPEITRYRLLFPKHTYVAEVLPAT